ncbi:MAG: hypothetical protein ABSC55_08470 [Syntrophorhabdales bacterium]|jgi:hypothetical protein
MTKSQELLSPAQQLSKKIVSRLVDKGLLTNELALQIESNVADGKMQTSDWKLTFEKSLGLHKKPVKE